MSYELRITHDVRDDECDDLTPPEVPVPDRLDFLAAELPEEYEGPWIVKLVRSFGGSRGAGGDVLEDLFQTACEAAAVAIAEARAKGRDTTAFVKTAVPSALSKCNRKYDKNAKHVTLAEDGARLPDADPNERLVEQFPDAEYRPSRQQKVDAVRLAAIIVSPPVRRYWRAFRTTDGSDRAVARRLGLGRFYVGAVLAPRARAEFAEALRWVGLLKGGAL